MISTSKPWFTGVGISKTLTITKDLGEVGFTKSFKKEDENLQSIL